MVDLLQDPVITINGEEHIIPLTFDVVINLRQSVAQDSVQELLTKLMNGSPTESAQVIHSYLRAAGIKKYSYKEIGSAMLKLKQGESIEARVPQDEGGVKTFYGQGVAMALYALIVSAVTESTKNDDGDSVSNDGEEPEKK